MIVGVRTLRHVRVHLTDNAPTIEGLLWGRRPRGGHYRILSPRVVEQSDRSFELDGEVAIPSHRVAFIQVLTDAPTPSSPMQKST